MNRRGKALKGVISFILIMSAIGIAWWINYTFQGESVNGENVTLEDSIKRGKERAQVAKDSAQIADSVYTASEGDLKQTKDEINNNTATIAYKRDSLRATFKAKAYADSVRHANRK
jgi:hypothetical protein